MAKGGVPPFLIDIEGRKTPVLVESYELSTYAGNKKSFLLSCTAKGHLSALLKDSTIEIPGYNVVCEIDNIQYNSKVNVTYFVMVEAEMYWAIRKYHAVAYAEKLVKGGRFS